LQKYNIFLERENFWTYFIFYNIKYMSFKKFFSFYFVLYDIFITFELNLKTKE